MFREPAYASITILAHSSLADHALPVPLFPRSMLSWMTIPVNMLASSRIITWLGLASTYVLNMRKMFLAQSLESQAWIDGIEVQPLSIHPFIKRN